VRPVIWESQDDLVVETLPQRYHSGAATNASWTCIGPCCVLSFCGSRLPWASMPRHASIDAAVPLGLRRAHGGLHLLNERLRGHSGSNSVQARPEPEFGSSLVNKLHLQARSRLAELEGRRAVSAQFEPMAEKVKEYSAMIRDRLDQLTFEGKREVLDVLQAEFTLEKDGQFLPRTCARKCCTHSKPLTPMRLLSSSISRRCSTCSAIPKKSRCS
jgi:hypothetical protein